MPYENNLNLKKFRPKNKYRAYNGQTTETVKYPWVYKFSQENALKYDQEGWIDIKATHSFHIQRPGLSTAFSFSVSIILSLHDTECKLTCIQHTEDFVFPIWLGLAVFRRSRTGLIDFTFTFHFHALEKGTATHSSVLAWRIPGMGEPDGLLSMGVPQSRTWQKRLSSSTEVTYIFFFLFWSEKHLQWISGSTNHSHIPIGK